MMEMRMTVVTTGLYSEKRRSMARTKPIAKPACNTIPKPSRCYQIRAMLCKKMRISSDFAITPSISWYENAAALPLA